MKAVHDLAVGGVPNGLRVRVWSQLSGVATLMASYPTHYKDMLAVGEQMDEHDRNEVEIDLGRTFPDHPLFAGDHILPDADRMAVSSPRGGDVALQTDAPARSGTPLCRLASAGGARGSPHWTLHWTACGCPGASRRAPRTDRLAPCAPGIRRP